MRIFVRGLLVLALSILVLPRMHGQDTPKGQRVYSVGHSFHYFMPPILTQIATNAGIKDHKFAGLSAIGGSRVYQHWNVPEDKFQSKKLLKEGAVDVLTLAPIFLPDDGIENFTKLALEHNPKVRVTVQEFWLPFDMYEPTFKERPAKVDHNSFTIEQLRKMHEPYFKSIDEHVIELNKKFGKDVLTIAPVGQAVLELRDKIIAGKAPGLKEQSDLFTDAIGHAKAPLMALVGYVHYAQIYGKSPVGVNPPMIAKGLSPELNRLLQEIAWNAVTAHPLSGVKK